MIRAAFGYLEQGREMSIKTKIALTAAIVLGSAVAAPAATKTNKIAIYHSQYAHPTAPRSPVFSDPDSPQASGGGSLGYNRSQYDDW
jgi:hypothetical protein